MVPPYPQRTHDPGFNHGHRGALTGMAKMEMDAVDASLLVAGLASAFMLVGVASFDLFGVTFSDVLFSPAGIGLSTAWVIGYASIVGTIVTNDNTEFSSLSDDIQGLQGYYMAAAIGTLALPVAFVVSPTVADFFTSADLWGLVYVVAVTSGQFALGWML